MTQQEDLKAARSTASLPSLTSVLWPEGRREAIDAVVPILSNDPVFDKDARRHLSRSELLERGYAIQLRLLELRRDHRWSQEQFETAMMLVDDHVPYGLHFNAFIPVLKSQGSDEQIARWLPRCLDMEVVGCYAQTELGHGSNVQGLETTATFENGELILQSPSVTAAKWWVGGLGTVANHAVVQAQLIVKGRSLGPHLFIVQLRDLQTHKTLPGIVIGDIGPKHYGGFNMNDNGFARFDKVRVPLENFLCRYASLSREGVYTPAKHAKIGYGSMVALRAGMPLVQGLELAKCATIAVRYTTVRRQFSGKDGVEQQVIKYSSVRERLFPILARAYVYVLTGHTTMSLYREMLAKLVAPPHDASLLAEVHLLTAGLKASLSWRVADGMEESRKALGGHGFSMYSGIGERFAREVPGQTYEGDNYVLTQQTARGLLKNLQNGMSGKPTMSCFRPLGEAVQEIVGGSAETGDVDWDSRDAVLALLCRRTASILLELGEQAQSRPWNDLNFLCVRLTKAFIEHYTAIQFFDTAPQPLHPLGHIYLLSNAIEALTDLSERPGLLPSPASCHRLRYEAWPKALGALDSLAVPLTDAFGFTDFELNSCLGRHDGAVYDALWKQVNEKNPINTTALPGSVVPGWERYLRHMPEVARGFSAGAKL
ncbi:hypothetical protein PYCC9005_005436 [Savitreella phatthalungensis]